MAELEGRVAGEDQDQDSRQRKSREQCRQQSAGATDVELLEFNGGCAFDLLQQQTGDQKA